MAKFIKGLGILTPLGPETAYSRNLQRFANRVWDRLTGDVLEITIDLEEVAIDGASAFVAASDRVHRSRIRESFRTYFGDAADDPIASALGVDVDARLQVALERNTDLIRDISAQQRRLISEQILAVSDDPLVDRLQTILKGSTNRARLIARDQAGKINSELSQTRHLAAGAEEYEWSTSRDERVRDLHSTLNGRAYSYGAPTDAEGGQAPGIPVQCRCVAVPKF